MRREGVPRLARGIWALIVAVLLTAPLPVRGEPPLPGVTSCPIELPDHRTWAGGEHWAWRRICTGQQANLSEYGAYDCQQNTDDWPTKSELSGAFLATITHPRYLSRIPSGGIGIACARIVDEIALSDRAISLPVSLDNVHFKEPLVLDRTRITGFLSISNASGPKLSADSANFEGSLWIRMSDFAVVVLNMAQVDKQVSLSGSHINTLLAERLQVGGTLIATGAALNALILKNARIDGYIDIAGSDISGPLNAEAITVADSIFLRNGTSLHSINLNSAQIGANLELDGTPIVGDVSADGMRLQGALFMRGTKVSGNLSLRGVTIGTQAGLDGIEVGGKFLGSGMTSTGSFFLNRAIVSDLELTGAHVGGNLELDGSHVDGELGAENLTVGGTFFAREAKFDGPVNLVGAKVDEELDVERSTFARELNATRIEVRRILYANDAEFQDFALVGARIGFQLKLTGSSIAGKLAGDGLEVKGGLFLDRSTIREVHLRGAVIGHQLAAVDTNILERLAADGIQVNGSVFLRGKTQIPTVELRAATIAADLDLSGASVERVSLSGSRVNGELRLGGVTAPAPIWPDSGLLDLVSASIGVWQDRPDAWPPQLRLDGFSYGRLAIDTATRSTDWFVEWLSRDESRSSTAFVQLAKRLEAAQEPDTARDILYVARDQQRGKMPFGLEWANETLHWLVLGYGYRLHYLLPWFALLVIVGAVLFRHTHPQRGLSDAIIYSLDMLVPVIELERSNHEIVNVGLTRYYFYFLKLSGYVLVFVVFTVFGQQLTLVR